MCSEAAITNCLLPENPHCARVKSFKTALIWQKVAQFKHQSLQCGAEYRWWHNKATQTMRVCSLDLSGELNWKRTQHKQY